MSQARPSGGLWASVDARRKPASPAPTPRPARRLRWVADAALPLFLNVVGILVLLPPTSRRRRGGRCSPSRWR